MWKFLRFGQAKTGERESPVTLPPPAAAQGAFTNSAKRRELVKVVLRDTLRKHGVPGDWIGFEMVTLPGPADSDAHLIHLVVLKWHAQLMDYAPALQQQLWLGLSRFAPDTEHTQFTIAWKFAPDCGCPFSAMPEPSHWANKSSAAATAVPAPPVPPKKFDLPASEYDHRSSGFAPTQPGELS